MNTDIMTIVVGFTIGIQITAMFFILRIILKKNVPTTPYILLLVAMLFVTIIKLDYVFHFITSTSRIIYQAGTSIFFMVGFINIYSLLNKKL